MKEFIEKLIGRLEEKSLEHAIEGQQYGEDGYFDLETDQRNVMQGVDEAISIINELAEEYKEECEYKENFAPSGSVYFLTGCGTRHNGFLDKNRPYCGFCGKKIRVAPYQPEGE